MSHGGKSLGGGDAKVESLAAWCAAKSRLNPVDVETVVGSQATLDTTAVVETGDVKPP